MLGRAYHEGWRPIRPIGKGGQGTTVLMQRKSDGVLAICKKVDDYELIDGMPVEAIILQDILPSSRWINKMIKFSFEASRRHHKDTLFEWFEYCRGGDLLNAVERCGRLSEDFIWHCFIQIAEALNVVHNAGSQRIVHRDVKSDNIFLDQKYLHEAPWPNLKLGDFGLASLEQRSITRCVALWQGPEFPHQSAAGDMWALGSVIHWLVHRQPPIAPRPARFRGSEEDWEMEPKARKPMPLNRFYTRDLNDTMMLCLQWNPGDRITSRELVDHFREARRQLRRR